MSDTDSSSEARITVGRWLSTYLVPADHPAPQDLRHRLDQCVTAQLADSCINWLGSVIDPADPSVWRVRELNLNCRVESSLPSDERIARVWGEQLASRIAEILARGEESDSILRFPNRAAFLAQFAIDLAAGRAWGKWYYDEFDSLSSLATSRAISEALLREEGQTAAVIVGLAALQRLDDVLNAVTEGDARRLYEACFTGAGTSPSAAKEESWTGRLLQLWIEAPLHPAGRDEGRFHDGLRLFARAARQFPSALEDTELRPALDGLLELRRVLFATRSPAALDRLIGALARDDLLSAVEVASTEGALSPSDGLHFFARMMDGDADWAAQAAGVVLSDKFQRIWSPAKAAFGSESILTLFGGIFLLGPSFAALNPDEIFAAAAADHDPPGEVARVLRHLVALKCLGRLRAPEAADDAVLRLFSGFDSASFLSALQHVGAERLDLPRAQAMLAERLASAERYEARCLFAETVPLPGSGGDVFLLRDLLQDEWIYAERLPGGASGMATVVEKGLALVREATGTEPEVLLLNGTLGALVDSSVVTASAGRVVLVDSWETFSWNELAAEFGVTGERLSCSARPAGQDLAYFSVASIWPDVEIEASFDLVWSLLARATLKHFARRLIGFGSSSPEHLYQNFLTGMSTVRNTGERIEVQLPRSPLAVVLRLSGVYDQVYVVPWLEGKEVCLLPPAD